MWLIRTKVLSKAFFVDTFFVSTFLRTNIGDHKKVLVKVTTDRPSICPSVYLFARRTFTTVHLFNNTFSVLDS
jgi:hypothetical protein